MFGYAPTVRELKDYKKDSLAHARNKIEHFLFDLQIDLNKSEAYRKCVALSHTSPHLYLSMPLPEMFSKQVSLITLTELASKIQIETKRSSTIQAAYFVLSRH